MRRAVNVAKSKKNGKWTVAVIYFKGKKYIVDNIANPIFLDGVTSYDIEIGKKKTKLYLDEIAGRWFVIPKAA